MGLYHHNKGLSLWDEEPADYKYPNEFADFTECMK